MDYALCTVNYALYTMHYGLSAPVCSVISCLCRKNAYIMAKMKVFPAYLWAEWTATAR